SFQNGRPLIHAPTRGRRNNQKALGSLPRGRTANVASVRGAARYFAAWRSPTIKRRAHRSIANGRLRPDRMLINVLFLSIVDAHKGLDRFDDALSVPDQVPIDFPGREAIGEPSKEPRQVD